MQRSRGRAPLSHGDVLRSGRLDQRSPRGSMPRNGAVSLARISTTLPLRSPKWVVTSRKNLGDGLMCLFGYPLAHENDAERAVRAALSIQRVLTELNRKNADTGKPELTTRIGLETGPAVVDAAGEIYGDVANVAARVQALAEPGTVLVTARVQRQVAGLFVAEGRGTHTLKGVPEPTALFRLVRASGGGRRSGQRNLTPLVGRDDEMAMLMRRWERARQSEGQLVLIVGEPGLGKSRLIEEFHLRLKETPHTWTEWTCSQLLQNTPLHPIAEWGRQRFGGADVPAERRLADLENSLAQVKLDPAENASLLAPLLDIPLTKERVPTLAPEELRRRQLAALTNWVMAGAKAQPLVLAFEDLHWADPTTLDVLRGIAERGTRCRSILWRRPGPSFARPGACGRITAPFHWRRSTAPRSAKWWLNFPHVTHWRAMSSMMSRRAPVAYRCSSRRSLGSCWRGDKAVSKSFRRRCNSRSWPGLIGLVPHARWRRSAR